MGILAYYLDILSKKTGITKIPNLYVEFFAFGGGKGNSTLLLTKSSKQMLIIPAYFKGGLLASFIVRNG
jgi:hypothetical protein